MSCPLEGDTAGDETDVPTSEGEEGELGTEGLTTPSLILQDQSIQQFILHCTTVCSK